MDKRLEVYVDLLRTTASLADNAMEWSAIPLADLAEVDVNELNRLLSQVRVVASKDVYNTFNDLSRTLNQFNRKLLDARLYHRSIRNTGIVDDTRSILQRFSLGGVAEEIRASHKKIEASIRKEMKS